MEKTRFYWTKSIYNYVFHELTLELLEQETNICREQEVQIRLLLPFSG
jgi:hypothetical protein